VTPEESADKFPLSTVTFDDEGTYSATRNVEGQAETMTGEYEWDGFKLKVTGKGGTTRVYPGHWNMFDGKLYLRHDSEKYGKMKAVLEKVKDEPAD
jgi:hypothetical protein